MLVSTTHCHTCDFLFFIQAVAYKISVLLSFPHCSFRNVSSLWDLIDASWLLQILGIYLLWWFFIWSRKKKKKIRPSSFVLCIHTYFWKGLWGHLWTCLVYCLFFLCSHLIQFKKKINWTLSCGYLCSAAEWQSNWPLKYTYHRFRCDVGIHS